MDQPIRVLHVDDEPDLAELAATYVSREDERIEVVTAAGPDAGERTIEADTIDCVVSDYDMPGRNGIEFLEAVRETDPTLPFILYTGNGSEEVASEAISAGVTDYLQKETGTDQYTVLANRIVNAVESERSRQALKTRNRELQRYKHMINSMHEGVCIYDEEGRFEIVNDYLVDWYDTPAETLVGQDSGLIAKIRTQADEGDPYAELVAGERDRIVTEVDGDFPGRGQAVLSARLSPLWIDDRVAGVVGIARDITDRKKRKRELEQVNVLLSTLFDTLPQGVLAEDDSRQILAVNQQLFDIFALSGTPAEVVGKDCREVAEQISDVFADPVAFVEVVERLVAEREPTDGEQFALRDGRTFALSYRPIELSNRRGHLWVYTDESERERLTGQLEAQYQTLFEEAPVMAAIIRTEADRPIIEDCNKQFAETLGYEKNAVIETELSAYYMTDSKHELLDGGGYRRSLDGDFTRERRTLKDADNEQVETLLRAVPRCDADGNVIGTLAMYVDITEREEIKRANERLEEFTRIVSHDLRNPLAVAEGRLSLARENCDSDHLAAVARANSRMSALIDDLLTLARDSETVIDTKPIELRSVAATCWKHVETAGGRLILKTDRVVHADERRLKHLFENLFRNAVEHGSTRSQSPDGDVAKHGHPDAAKAECEPNDVSTDGTVTVTVGDLDTGFYVEDDGVGIPEAERDKIFDSGYSATSEGTGFGLSIVKGVVDTHGWKISVADAPTGGARFEISGVTVESE